MISILVVDDEEKICDFVKAYLNKEEYNTFVAHNGKDAINILDNHKIDLAILDRMLPDISGEEIFSYIRSKNSIPIIMLTAKTEDEDRIDGFNLGCDDYICKPFNAKELVLRVKAVLKRVIKEESSIISFNNILSINQDSRDVIVRGKEVVLTNTEYKILLLMSKNPGRVYRREQLLENVLDEYYDKFDRVIDSHVKNLRHKIELDSKNPEIILTVYGVGYKFGLSK